MTFTKPTEQEYVNMHHEWLQENLRAAIGEISVVLASRGLIDILESEQFEPIVSSWKAALETKPPQLADIALKEAE